MNIYFVCCNVVEEKEAIKQIKPDKLLLSYYYFKNKNLEDFVNELGYKPEILLDSGAYSAFTKGKNISPIDYMNFITRNKIYIDKYITLDVIGEPELSKKYYEIMKLKGFDPLPVFHYGDDEWFLRSYIAEGCKYIALGNTVPIKDKNKVAAWVNELTEKYPDIQFHLLGSSSKKVTQNTDLYSVDSSTWIMMAINGFPKEITGRSREAKIERAKFQMLKIMEECK
jgi:hypothetical protein